MANVLSKMQQIDVTSPESPETSAGKELKLAEMSIKDTPRYCFRCEFVVSFLFIFNINVENMNDIFAGSFFPGSHP